MSARLFEMLVRSNCDGLQGKKATVPCLIRDRLSHLIYSRTVGRGMQIKHNRTHYILGSGRWCLALRLNRINIFTSQSAHELLRSTLSLLLQPSTNHATWSSSSQKWYNGFQNLTSEEGRKDCCAVLDRSIPQRVEASS